MDTKLTFWVQIKPASEKAANINTALSELMANVRGVKLSKRCLLISVTTSILLYEAEIWANALSMEKFRKRMAAVQKLGALIVACSYCTVSEPAILLVAGLIPIDLQAKERQYLYVEKAEVGKHEMKEQARAHSIKE